MHYGAAPAPNNVTIMHFVLWPLTSAYNSVTLKRNIQQRLKVVKIQQQQKRSTVSLGNSKLGKSKHTEIWSPGWNHY